MREIPIPEPVNVLKPDGTSSEPISFEKVLLELLNDPKAVKDFAALSKSLKVRNVVLALQPANAAAVSVLKLEDADWEHVCELIRHPTGGYNPNVAFATHHFMTAVLEAKPA